MLLNNMHINLMKTYVKPVTFPLLRVYTQNIYNVIKM